MVSKVEQEIFDCIENRDNFILDAGAGSGKTWTLVQALNYILSSQGRKLKCNGQKIVCITYTNVAKDEIIERTENNELIKVGTIHDFLWDCIKKFQSELRIEFIELLKVKLEKANETLDSCTSRAVKKREKAEEQIARYTEAISQIESNSPKIAYKNYPNYKKGIFSHDQLIILAEKIFSSYPKIRKIVTDSYPIIFVDEYQDTQKETISILLNYLSSNSNFLLGFFGDKHQQIYDTGVGAIPDEFELKLIQKRENYRSSEQVIRLLNNVRSDIEQYQPESNTRQGQVIFFNKLGDAEFNAGVFIDQNLIERWNLQSCKDVKILYLTHRYIAKENQYEELYSLHKNADIITKNKDNRGISPFTDFLFDIEDAVSLFNEKRIQQLLKNIAINVNTFESKKRVQELMSKLLTLRLSGSIREIIDFVVSKSILKATEKMDRYDFDDESKQEFHDALMELEYSQFVRLYQVQQNNTPFSTKHNTKGDEFDNVMVVIDDNAWRNFNFNDFFSNDHENEKRFSRTNNLFYVVCSRAKKNLAVVCSSDLSATSINTIKTWFQEENYLEV